MLGKNYVTAVPAALGSMVCAVAVAFVAMSFAPVMADDGTGFDTDGSGDAMMLFIGDNPYKDHRDFVEDNGTAGCVGCHDLMGIGYTNDFAPGCLTCHGVKWDDAVFDPAMVTRSAGVLSMASFGIADNPQKQHRDYVEENGVAECVDCHALNAGGYENAPGFPGPGCLSCHGVKWDDDDDDDDKSDDDSS